MRIASPSTGCPPAVFPKMAVSPGQTKTARSAETETHILCPRPASNRQPLKYSAGPAGGAPEVQNQWRGRIDFGGRSRIFLILVRTFHNEVYETLAAVRRASINTK